MVLGEGLTSISLTLPVTGGDVLVVMLWQEGSTAFGTGGESSLALTSVGSDSPALGEPLLQ